MPVPFSRSSLHSPILLPGPNVPPPMPIPSRPDDPAIAEFNRGDPGVDPTPPDVIQAYCFFLPLPKSPPPPSIMLAVELAERCWLNSSSLEACCFRCSLAVGFLPESTSGARSPSNPGAGDPGIRVEGPTKPILLASVG